MKDIYLIYPESEKGLHGIDVDQKCHSVLEGPLGNTFYTIWKGLLSVISNVRLNFLNKSKSKLFLGFM